MDTAFKLLSASVTCDFATAFYRSSGAGLLKQRDSRGRLSDPVFMRRYLELTPALPVAMANPGIKIVSTRTVLPRRRADLHQIAFYREIMRVEGWRHAVALCFWGAPPADTPIFVMSVYRREGRRDFSAKEVALLKRVHPFIDAAVDRLHEREAGTTVREGIAIAVRNPARGFAVIDHNLRLVHANPIGRELCDDWMNEAAPAGRASGSTAWQLPPQIEGACRDLHDAWASLLRMNPDASGLRHPQPVLHPHRAGSRAWITLVCPTTADLAAPVFVLEFERTGHGESTRAAPASVLAGMTSAERVVAMVLADGLSNQEIADRLGKTLSAVKFLLHRIYQKTGIPSRSGLVAALTTGRPSVQPGFAPPR